MSVRQQLSGVRRRLHVSERGQRGLVRSLQLVMIGIFSIGLYTGNLGVVVNAGVGLAVTELPALLERRYGLTMNAGLVLWITLAMFLHALGTLPLPGLDFLTPYTALWWWDHVTHTLSASLVAAVAYAFARALDAHSDAITLPPRFTFVYLLLFAMAFGVLWELLEFYIGVVSQLLGAVKVLTQYGLGDTVADLMYDTVGALLVALFGTIYLTDVADQLADRLDRRSEE